jgi:hypothetical protein
MEVPQTLSINLEIVPENENDSDPAAVNMFASRVISTLQSEQERYLILPLPTSQRGGLTLLFQVIIQGIQTIDSALLAQKDLIGVYGELLAIFTTVSAPILLLFKTHKKQSPSEQQHTIHVKMKIDDTEIEITSADVADDKRIMQLAEQFHKQHPQIKPTPQSKITVQARVPKQPPRRKH